MTTPPPSGRTYQRLNQQGGPGTVAVPAPTTTPVYAPPRQQQYGVAPVAHFRFDGGAATYFGVGIASFLLVVCTLGLLTPWAVVLRYRWRTKHTLVNGQRCRFTGGAWGLFGSWLKWWLLTLITLGIYSFWVFPRLTRWIVEHQEFDMIPVQAQQLA